MLLINKINEFFIKPSKEWLIDYYKCDKNNNIVDDNIYIYPNNHLNYLGGEKYLNKIINILSKKTNINEVTFKKSQPCIFEKSNDLSNQPDYYWSYPGMINIYINTNYNIYNIFDKYLIKRMIFKLNEKYEYITTIIFNDKKIYQ